MSRSAAELILARQVAEHYRDRAAVMEREALLLAVGGKPLHSRICKQYAYIARNAARAEEWSDIDVGRHGDEPLAFDDEGTLL
jgi:hypothetical protein